MLIPFSKFLIEKYKYYDNRGNLIKKMKKQSHTLVEKFITDTELSTNYIQKKTRDKRNKMILYNILGEQEVCDDDGCYNGYTYSFANIPGIVLYRIIMKTSKKTRVYIPLISICEGVRSCGYGGVILHELIEYFTRNKPPGYGLELVLLSLEESVGFYKKFGFQETMSHFIMKYEMSYTDEIMMIYRYTVP